MSIVLQSTSGGSVTINEPTTASNFTQTLPAGTGTVAVQGASTNIVSGTAVASTSGTSIDFTSIPSWVKRITVMLNGVSTSGSSVVGIRLGTSGGVVATGYNGSAADLVNTGTVVAAADTSMLLLGAGSASQTAASVRYGIATISLLDSATNTWVHSGSLGFSNSAMTTNFGGRIALASALTTVRITAINGTDTFDAGTINILYE